ncbi:MAG: NrdJb, partial [Candidatus Macondimonas sp.]
MAIKITQPITSYRVVREEDKVAAPAPAVVPQPSRDNVIQMHERLERPDLLVGATYKIKPPVGDHAMYITINDLVLNEGTEHQHRRPFEIFINSKNMEH